VSDRLSRRAVTTAVTTLLVVGALLVSFAGPAVATPREGFEVKPNTSVDKKEYPALVGVNPQTQVDLSTPSDCNTVTYCDTIPFTVEPPPDLKEDDNFYVTVTVAWEDPNKADDVDILVYDNGQLQGGAVTRMGKSSTSNNPEKVDLQQPTLGEYQLVVQNTSGVNNGYTVSAKMFMGKFESPVEQLAPPARETTTTTATTVAPPHEDLGPPTTLTHTTLAPIAVAHDDSLDFTASDFQSQITDPATEEFLAQASALRKPPVAKAPSTIALIIWFVIAPIILCGGAVAFLYRRRRGILFAT
jgi:hypothetical protein